jgi:hypothetical protein
MKQSTQTFEDYLREMFPVMDRKHLGSRGIRLWRVSGDQANSEGDLVKQMLSVLKEALPSETSVLVFQNALLNYFYRCDNSYRDEYSLIFCSSAWPKLEQGAIIPEIRVTWIKSNSTVVPFYCQIQYIVDPSIKDYKDTLSVFLDTILDPSATSSNVIAVARELKKQLDSEHVGIPDAED